MAHGTPAGPADIAAFYTEIRRGRPPSPEQLADLERRYAAIGGISPLAARSRAHADGIAAALDALAPGGYVVELGYRFAAPLIEDAVGALAARGAGRVVGVVLAPHYSAVSIGEYARRARVATSSLDPPRELVMVECWHRSPVFAALHAERVREALLRLPADAVQDAVVLFTAHSLPGRIVDDGDPYADQVAESARAVAATALLTRFEVAWQSAGRTDEAWLRPDVNEVIASLPGRGATGVVVAPVGFVSEHLEVLYDLDIEAATTAARAGIPFARAATLDGDPRVARLLADTVMATASSADADGRPPADLHL